MTAAIAAAIALAARDPQVVRVDYQNAGADAKRLLGELSKATGIRLEPTRETQHEVLCVRFAGERLSDAMAQIAWATQAEWERKDGVYRLTRSTAEQLSEEKKELDLRAAPYRIALANRRRDVEAMTSFDETAADKLADDFNNLHPLPKAESGIDEHLQQFMFIQAKGPIDRLMKRLATTLDPNDLAKMPVRYRETYSDQPTASERTLDPTAIDAIHQFIQEQAQFAKALGEHGIAASDEGVGREMKSIREGDVARVTFTVMKLVNDMIVHLRLELLDRQGKPVMMTGDVIMPRGQPVRAAPATAVGKAIPCPADLVDLPSLWQWNVNRGPVAALRNVLTTPETHEPLSIMHGRLLLQIAASRNLPLVADLPDGAIRIPAPKRRFVPEAWLASDWGWACERNMATEWLGLRPRAPAFNRFHRADRQALGTYLRRYAMQTAPTLDELATFAVELPEHTDNSLPTDLRLAVAPASTNMDAHDQEVLEFYGNLGATQRSNAREGSIPLGGLSDEARGKLERLLHDPLVSLEVTGDDGKAVKQPGLAADPCESLADGIPASGRLRIEDAMADVARTPHKLQGTELGGGFTVTPEEVARAKFAEERPDLFPQRSANPDPMIVARLQIGKESQHRLLFRFTPSLSLTEELDIDDFADGAWTEYGDIPDGFRVQVDAELDRLRKAHGG